MKSFHLELIAIDKKVYDGRCDYVALPAIDGSFGVLTGHSPVVLALSAGELRYTVDGKSETLAVGVGFADVTSDSVIVLVDFAERADEIDLIRAQAAKARAEERIRSKQDALALAHAQAALSRAIARIRVSSRRMGR